jgi:hypothetical protein
MEWVKQENMVVKRVGRWRMINEVCEIHVLCMHNCTEKSCWVMRRWGKISDMRRWGKSDQIRYGKKATKIVFINTTSTV